MASTKICFYASVTCTEQPVFRPCSGLGKRKTQQELDAKRQQSLHLAHERKKEEFGDRYQKRPRGGQSTRTRNQGPGDEGASLTRGANAYKIGQPMSSLQDLKRQVQNVLNKMTRDKYEVLMKEHVADQILPSIKDTVSLDLMVSVIFTKAVEEAKHGFADLYANMCVELNAAVALEGQQQPFVRALVKCCASAFADLPPDIECTAEEKRTLSVEDQELTYIRQKNRVLGNMQFIGELYKREMITSPVLRDVLNRLILSVDKPAELYVECICKLLATVGAKMEERQMGSDVISQVIEKLTSLANKGMYPMRMKFMIMDLETLRTRKWIDRSAAAREGEA